MSKKIDLSELTGNGRVRNLAGHESGVAARAHYGLDQLDKTAESVEITIPSYVYTLTASFFQGMFAESVRALGSKDAFLSRYRFNASALILKQIEMGISAAQMRRGELLSA